MNIVIPGVPEERTLVEHTERKPATLLERLAEVELLARLPWCIPVSVVLLGQGLDSGWLQRWQVGRGAGPGSILICAAPGYDPEAVLTLQGLSEAFPGECS